MNKTIYSIFSILFIVGISSCVAQPTSSYTRHKKSTKSVTKKTVVDATYIVNEINKIRSSNHKCGRKRMPAVDPIVWNKTLQLSASEHAKDMNRYEYFSHQNRKGESIGERIEKFDYDWMFVGENIAKGQKTFKETLKDWMKSKTHCKLIMSSDAAEIGMAKAGKYRVMHFGNRS